MIRPPTYNRMEKLQTRAFASRVSGIVGSILLALVIVGVDSVDRFLPLSRFEPGKPSPVSVRLPSTGYLRSSPAARVKVRFEHERFILRKGEIVPDTAAEEYKLLESTIVERHELLGYRALGVFIVTLLLGYLLSEAVRRSWPGNRKYLRTEISIFIVIALTALAAKPVFALTSLPVYIVPAAAGPIVISYYRGRRLGVYVSLLSSFILSLMLEFDAVAFMVFLVQGLSVVPFMRPTRKYGPVFAAGGVATVVGVVTLFGLGMAITGSMEVVGILNWSGSALLAVLAGGLLAAPLGWALALAIQPLLGIVTQGKLNDLQALQHPLLKRLQQEAPGTWEHSRAIANLAEEVASKIGADALLVRVGAYFHDLGKAINPNLFVENQEFAGEGRSPNPHDDLSPEKSASLIVDHVIQGVQILRNNSIPEGVVEFAYMHHGTSVVEYFWNRYRDQCKKKGLDKPALPKSAFAYPGMPPQSPEAGIMMLADSVEAASRSIPDPTVEDLEKVVDHIIFTKLAEGQLEASGLTVKDLRVVAQCFVESLHFSRHKRVKYQWQVREEAAGEQPPAPAPAKAPAPAPAKEADAPRPAPAQAPEKPARLAEPEPPEPRVKPQAEPDAVKASSQKVASPVEESDEPGKRKAPSTTLSGIGPAPDKQ